MKNQQFFSLVLLLLLASCKAQQTSTPITAVQQATAEVVAQTVDVVDTWQGTIPCADCPGINYTIQLFPDQTYQERLVYLEKNTEPFEQSGTWKVDASGVLNLQKPPGHGMTKFRVRPDRLVMLDMEGKAIVSGAAGNYSLERINIKQQEAQNPQVRQDQFVRGTDFIAMGNEPSWYLEIDRDSLMSFKALDAGSTAFVVPTPEPMQLQGTESINYTAETEAGEVSVKLLRSRCTDTMAGKEYPYTVSVKIDNKQFDGCGMYLSDNRLSSKWALQQLKGKEVKPPDFPREVPLLEFDLEQNRVSGTGGCNQINGKIEVKGDSITIKQIASTRMTCPTMGLEDDFLKLLADNAFRYKIEQGRLMLLQDNMPVLVFKKEN